jgi:hypothetical protein
VLARQRVELVDGEELPRHAYHVAQQQALSVQSATALVERVERAAITTAVDAMQAVVDEFGVQAAGVVAKPRSLPSLERILGSHALLHAAEGALFERALVGAAGEIELPVSVSEPGRLVVDDALDAMRKTLGPPWGQDQKLAAAAALVAIGRS